MDVYTFWESVYCVKETFRGPSPRMRKQGEEFRKFIGGRDGIASNNARSSGIAMQRAKYKIIYSNTLRGRRKLAEKIANRCQTGKGAGNLRLPTLLRATPRRAENRWDAEEEDYEETEEERANVAGIAKPIVTDGSVTRDGERERGTLPN